MRIKVVYGPPLGGKTTYVLNNKQPEDILFDYDLIMSAITGRATYNHNKSFNDYVIAVRQLLIDMAGCDTKPTTFWITINKVSDQLKKELTGLSVEYIEIDPGQEEVHRRLLSSPDGRDITLWKGYIDNYYTTRAKPKTSYNEVVVPFYSTAKWKRTRERVLKRDFYLCRECKRYGKDTQATMVHHVIPFKERSDLKIDTRNLISLCLSCHNQMHDRDTNELTATGKQWVKRTWDK